MYKYTKIQHVVALKEINNIKMFIPNDENNADYQEFQQWLAEGNVLVTPDDPTNTNSQETKENDNNS